MVKLEVFVEEEEDEVVVQSRNLGFLSEAVKKIRPSFQTKLVSC